MNQIKKRIQIIILDGKWNDKDKDNFHNLTHLRG